VADKSGDRLGKGDTYSYIFKKGFAVEAKEEAGDFFISSIGGIS